MNLTLQVLLILSIIILAAKFAGSLSHRIGQPSVFGELLIGLILGPSLLNILGWRVFPQHEEVELVVKILAELGVIFLMFLAGLETDLAQMRKVGFAASTGAIGGMALPFAAGMGISLAFGFPLVQSIFVGTILTATSVSISAQTLIELGQIKSKEGTTILGAAVIDDVLGILLVSFVVAFTVSGAGEASGAAGVVLLLGRIALFFVVAILLGSLFLEAVVLWVEERVSASEAVFAFGIVIMLLYSWAAEALGDVAAITGAYIAGILFARTSFKVAIEERIKTTAYAFLVPVFFVSIGLEANARELGGSLLYAALIILAAVVSKAVGMGIGTFIARFTFLESLRAGTGMISRGEVGLIVAAIGLNFGVITRDVFSAMAIMVLFTTMVTPPLLRLTFKLGSRPAEVRGVSESPEEEGTGTSAAAVRPAGETGRGSD